MEQPAPSTLTTVPGCCWCWSLTMGAPRWPTRAGLGGSWFSSMMQGEVIPRGARYSAIITAQYTSSRNTLRPAGREGRVVRYRGSILQAVRNKPRLLHLAFTYGCPTSGTASPASGTLQIYSWPTACPYIPTQHFYRTQSAIHSPAIHCKAVRAKAHQGLGMRSSNQEPVLLLD